MQDSYRYAENFNQIDPTANLTIEELCVMFINSGYERGSDYGAVFRKHTQFEKVDFEVWNLANIEDGKRVGKYYLKMCGWVAEINKFMNLSLLLFDSGRTLKMAEQSLIALYLSKVYNNSEMPKDRYIFCR